jgi:hypothetical protein
MSIRSTPYGVERIIALHPDTGSASSELPCPCNTEQAKVLVGEKLCVFKE